MNDGCSEHCPRARREELPGATRRHAQRRVGGICFLWFPALGFPLGMFSRVFRTRYCPAKSSLPSGAAHRHSDTRWLTAPFIRVLRADGGSDVHAGPGFPGQSQGQSGGVSRRLSPDAGALDKPAKAPSQACPSRATGCVRPRAARGRPRTRPWALYGKDAPTFLSSRAVVGVRVNVRPETALLPGWPVEARRSAAPALNA